MVRAVKKSIIACCCCCWCCWFCCCIVCICVCIANTKATKPACAAALLPDPCAVLMPGGGEISPLVSICPDMAIRRGIGCEQAQQPRSINGPKLREAATKDAPLPCEYKLECRLNLLGDSHGNNLEPRGCVPRTLCPHECTEHNAQN